MATETIHQLRQDDDPNETGLGQRLHAERRARLAQERRAAERRERDAVGMYAEASETALAWMRRYIAGWAGSVHPSVVECEGRMLALAFPNGSTLTAECARRARLAG
jgi:hypothetical protein